MDAKVKMRLTWVQLYEKTANFSLTSRHCGISRPTLRKWVTRYQQLGLDGLLDQSRRPKTLARTLKLRLSIWSGLDSYVNDVSVLGAFRVNCYIYTLSTATIHKVLKQEGYGLLKPTRRPCKGRKRYQKEIPGERVNMDVCKIDAKLYQFTVIDDCTSLKVIRLYPNKKADSTLAFLEQVITEFPFPIQRIQTDRGEEFMAHKVQYRLMELGIKFRPTKPRSPHLNGKVERTQRTDLEEFYSLVEIKATDLAEQLQRWQEYYNRERRHRSIGKSPWQKWQGLSDKTPTTEQVYSQYDRSKERIQSADYQRDRRRARWFCSS